MIVTLLSRLAASKFVSAQACAGRGLPAANGAARGEARASCLCRAGAGSQLASAVSCNTWSTPQAGFPCITTYRRRSAAARFHVIAKRKAGDVNRLLSARATMRFVAARKRSKAFSRGRVGAPSRRDLKKKDRRQPVFDCPRLALLVRFPGFETKETSLAQRSGIVLGACSHRVDSRA